MPLLPCILHAIPAENSSNNQIYRDLSKHQFSIQEKTDICRCIQEKLVKVKELTANYNIPMSTIYSWKKTLDYDLPLLSQGRQQSFDDKSTSIVVSTVTTAAEAKTPLSPVQLNALLASEREKTNKRRKRKLSEVEDNENVPTSEDLQRMVQSRSAASVPFRTKRRLFKSLRLAQVKSDSMTGARFAACADPRSSYTWLAVNVALCGHLKGPYKWNMDPTTIQVGDEGVLSIIPKGDEGIHCHNRNQSGDLCIFIKWLHLCSAGGQMSDLVLCVAIDSLNEEDFFFSPVQGLTKNVGSLDYGYLLFTKTRAGNDKLWRWYFSNICIPTIAYTKNILRYKCKYLNSEDNLIEKEMPSVISTDGEQVALEAGMDADILESFRSADIHYLKLPASTSGIHQACDRAPTFRCVKAGMQHVQKHGIHIEDNGNLKPSIEGTFTDLIEKYPHAEVTSAFKEKVYKGCLSLTWVFKEKYLKESSIIEGFTSCGQHRCISDELVESNHEFGLAYSTVDYKLILNQCYQHIPQNEIDVMIASLPDAIQKLNTEGYISDQFMDEKNIMKSSTTVQRDNLVLNRGYAQVLSHEGNAERFHCYLTDRYLASDPIQIQKRKEKEMHLKTIRAYDKKQTKAREAFEKREAEKRRKRGLSKAEREREASENRRIKLLNKQQKETEELRKYNAALLALGDERGLQSIEAVDNSDSSSEDDC